MLGFGVPDPRTGHIVVEMRTPHSAALLKYSCSKRVLALPTVQLNARRWTAPVLLLLSARLLLAFMLCGACMLCPSAPVYQSIAMTQRSMQLHAPHALS